MVELVATNDKLRVRGVRILVAAAEQFGVELGPDEAAATLARCDGDIRLAVVHALSGRPVDECRRALEGTVVRAPVADLWASGHAR